MPPLVGALNRVAIVSWSMSPQIAASDCQSSLAIASLAYMTQSKFSLTVVMNSKNSPSFCWLMAFATSSADAYSVPANPRAANARPMADVSAFSRAEVRFILLAALTSSAKPVANSRPCSLLMLAFITTSVSLASTSSVLTVYSGCNCLNSFTRYATVLYCLP